jgi:hypothetical protein
MSTGYRNDQFYGIERAGETGNQLRPGSATGVANNPPFIYPAREIITQDGRGSVTRTRMQRGYIRTLLSQSQGVNIPLRKCAFQFNPQYLSTSVAMAQDVLNAYQQDIGQFAVPLAGNSTFIVQLFFDRSMELANGPRAGTPTSADPNVPRNIFSGNEALDPSVIGVLRDIGELNSIIGAGLSSDLKAFTQDSLTTQINAQYSTINNPTADEQAGRDAALENVGKVISDLNYGNSAFLIPNPVRLVFSSLFMVEGFVTNVDINYTKFTHTMIPMQATVSLAINAQYIGYAKAKTYVTESLAASAQFFADQQQAKQDSVDSFTAALQSSVSNVFAYVSSGDVMQNVRTPDDLLVTYLDDVLGVNANGGGDTMKFRTIFPNALKADGTINPEDPSYVAVGDSGLSVGFNQITTLAISGPFDTPTGTIGVGTPLRSTKTTGTVFRNLAEGTIVGPDFNGANVSDAIRTSGKYWTIRWEIKITVTLDDVTSVGTGTYVSVVTSMSTPVAASIPVSWVGATVEGAADPTRLSVPTTNAATTVPAPGATSTVGSPNRTARGLVRS